MCEPLGAVQSITNPSLLSLCCGFLPSFTLSSREAFSGSTGSNGLGFTWAYTGKQYRRCGVHRERV